MRITALLLLSGFALFAGPVRGGEEIALFDGENLEHWDFAEGAWEIDENGHLTCNMKEVVTKSGEKKQRGMGFIWTKREFGDFRLTLSYRLSEGANSGVFYRTDRDDPVHRGFEVQLMDDEGFQETHGEKDARKLNGSFYDASAPEADPANPVGEWDTLTLTCKGPRITCEINGVQTFDVNVNDWPEVGENPDGTSNKFKVAIKDKPRRGHIGLQNHGQYVWFRDIRLEPLD